MADKYNNILGLQLPTDPRWVNLAEISLEFILTDHAYCEMKAATSAISIIQRFNNLTELVKELSPMVTEEWGHFRLVLQEINKRGFTLGPNRKDDYVNALLQHTKKGASEEEYLLDKLLVFALIEARSCERFRLLANGLADDYLKSFYKKFMESEAGHYRMFLDLAHLYIAKDKVEDRWNYWLKTEQKILQNLETRGDRMH